MLLFSRTISYFILTTLSYVIANTRFTALKEDTMKELSKIANTLVRPGVGILAADESVSTIGKRFDDIGLENTPENRRNYRELLFSANPTISNHISGVILFDETLHQKASNGKPLIELLNERGIIPGIKVDQGLYPMNETTKDEMATDGLDGLEERCAEYKKLGCHFAKWRCVFKITDRTPTPQAIIINANIMARYAAACQSNGIVPIVEPEVLQDGDHDIEKCKQVTENILNVFFKILMKNDVYLEGILLKPNMITPGKSYKGKVSSETIANATIETLQNTVPAAVPGVVFLSGGQTEEEASVNLNAINKKRTFEPWRLTFSFGRALQASAIQAWKGKKENLKSAQRELIDRARAHSQATLGEYIPGSVVGAAARKDLFVKDHSY